jgi:uncharacterized protein YndB with AHSA1/START domain
MYSIYHDLVISASKEKVFEGFTSPIHLNNWWALKSSGNPVLDSEYNLNFTDEYNWFCKVSKVQANKHFYLIMTTSSEDWQNTTFGIELEELKNGTLLKFSHLGWRDCNAEFRNSSFCWAILLNGLKKYLEEGLIIPFSKRN